MSLFRSNPDPKISVAPELVRSRFHQILDKADTAYNAMNDMASILSSLIMDCEKGMKFIDRFRVDLTKSIGDTGINPVNIEEEMKAYAPKDRSELTG